MKITTVGIDIAKSVFHVVAVTDRGTVVKKKQLKRKELLAFIAQLEPCRIALEACGGAHYWAREFTKLGHEVKLIAPHYVKPYVKGNKNDYHDAEAIAEAAQRPNMRFVPIKTQEQQDIQALHRLRERSVKERTALANQIRGLLAEYGIVIRLGLTAVRKALPEILEDGENGLTPRGRACFAQLYDELIQIDAQCARYEQQIVQINQEHAVCRRLDEVIGIGPITATATYAAAGSAREFRNGRHFSAWLGLVPKQHSSGGKDTLLGISKRGNAYLRTLFIHGARAVLRTAATKNDRFSRWANALHARRGHNRACVAVANKLARIAWVVMAKGEAYRPAV